MAYKGMTFDEAARIVRAHLIDQLADCDMAAIAGFPADLQDLRGAARLRIAQEQVLRELRNANGEPAHVVRRPRP